MAFVNVGTTITKALTKITGGIPRPTLTTWFNEIVDDILGQPREWAFLTAPLTIAITDNQIILPAGTAELVSIQIDSAFYDRSCQLSAKEAADIAATGWINPLGYTLDAAGVVTFYPPTNGASAIVTVEQDVTADYADNADTVFPAVFQGLFLSGLRKEAFYVDKDGRFTAEQQIYDQKMSECKAWDNRLKPSPHFNQHGYVR